MKPTNGANDTDRQKQVVTEARRSQMEREKGYREQALKLFPWVCARCGREFSGAKLRMLTVHHKDHNHDNNPKDGGNWELLCLYCHDNEHSRYTEADLYGNVAGVEEQKQPSTYKAFAGLEKLLSNKKGGA
jgi:hypothetical protein